MLAIAYTDGKRGFSDREPFVLEVDDKKTAKYEIEALHREGETAFAFDYPGEAGREAPGAITWQYAKEREIVL